MTDAEARRTLGDLAAELGSSVERASRRRSGAELAAGLNALRSQVEALGADVRSKLEVLLDAPEVVLSPETAEQLRGRRAWVGAALGSLRAALSEDPAAVRQGSVWREAKRALDAYARDLDAVVETAWSRLAAGYEQGDERLLERLPPDAAGLDDYRRAVRVFHEHAGRTPTTAQDVRRLAGVGERMASLRERLQRDAVPSELQEQWRLLHDGGLRLDELTDEFRAWLHERAYARQVVLRFDSA